MDRATAGAIERAESLTVDAGDALRHLELLERDDAASTQTYPVSLSARAGPTTVERARVVARRSRPDR
jgi:predicted ArsR family transcriptional regulator